MVGQNFGNSIAARVVERASLDFWRNGENQFQVRSAVYNKLIKQVISSKTIPNTRPRKSVLNYAFIAGGFFTNYVRDTFASQEDYEAMRAQQDVNVFVEYPKHKTVFSPTVDELRSVLAPQYKSAPVADAVFIKNVFCTFAIPDALTVNGETFRNVRVHVCADNCENMLRKFTFEPCKIAYQYGSNSLRVSNWFQTGGKVVDEAATSQKTAQLLTKYAHKNLTDTTYDANPHTIIPFIFVQEPSNTELPADDDEDF